MIVASKDDVVSLSGSLHKNQWLTIKAAANLLLRDRPEGIIIDCSELTEVSEDGAKTFLDAMKDIQAAGARIMVSNLPPNVLQVIRTVPGVRSQLPIATSVEEARRSLRAGGVRQETDADRALTEGGIVLPLLPGLDVEYALTIASRLSRETGSSIHLVYLLIVPRHLPPGAPLGDAETAAHELLARADQVAKRLSIRSVAHIERVRDEEEGLLQLLRTYKAKHVVLGAFADRLDDELFHNMVDVLLHRAPCGVLIGRKALPPDETTPDTGRNGVAPFDL